jgi:HEAT repeat protein
MTMRSSLSFGTPKGLIRHLVIFLLLASGCSKKKSTDELIADLKSPQEGDRLIAVRLLAQHKGEAAKVVPALIEAFQDRADDIRLSAAIGLGYFGDQAREAIPALQTAQRDPDARIREAASVALSRIDPSRFSAPTRGRPARGK